jgi:hypothetical protein
VFRKRLGNPEVRKQGTVQRHECGKPIESGKENGVWKQKWNQWQEVHRVWQGNDAALDGLSNGNDMEACATKSSALERCHVSLNALQARKKDKKYSEAKSSSSQRRKKPYIYKQIQRDATINQTMATAYHQDSNNKPNDGRW